MISLLCASVSLTVNLRSSKYCLHYRVAGRLNEIIVLIYVSIYFISAQAVVASTDIIDEFYVLGIFNPVTQQTWLFCPVYIRHRASVKNVVLNHYQRPRELLYADRVNYYSGANVETMLTLKPTCTIGNHKEGFSVWRVWSFPLNLQNLGRKWSLLLAFCKYPLTALRPRPPRALIPFPAAPAPSLSICHKLTLAYSKT